MTPARLTVLLAALLLFASLLVGWTGYSAWDAVISSTPLRRGDARASSLYAPVDAASGFAPERMGAMSDMVVGQALGDVNNDGWEDLYITDTQGPNTLYINQGGERFTVSEYSDTLALPDAISGGATFVDYDNDGWLDIYVMNWGPNTLFRNQQGMGFVDVTEQAGVGDDKNGKTAAWGDYDDDGYLDLYIANWSCTPDCGRPTEGDKDRLYHNLGNGTFADVTDLLGSGELRGAGFVASWVDIDNDGDLDIYLVNDEFITDTGNVLWRNEGPGCDGWCFTNISEDAGADVRVMGMGLATSDYDNDGDLDFYFSNAGPMVLLQNQGGTSFRNRAPDVGVENGDNIGWGAVFIDADMDGWRDLYVALASTTANQPVGNPLYLNDGAGGFTALSARDSGAADMGKTVGLAYGDVNNDGWVDLLVGNAEGGHVLYTHTGRNPANHRRVSFTLHGGGPVNMQAVGARVYLTDTTGLTQMQEVKLGDSLGAGSSTTLFFGLGEADIAQVRVVWPDGLEQTLNDIRAGRAYRIAYPAEDTLARQMMDMALPPWLVWVPAMAAGLLLLGGLWWSNRASGA